MLIGETKQRQLQPIICKHETVIKKEEKLSVRGSIKCSYIKQHGVSNTADIDYMKQKLPTE